MVKSAKSVRLSKYVIPLHYKINLTPDLEKFVFDGAEEIKIEILKPTNKITLHSIEIEILSAEIIEKKLKGKISYDVPNETATFSFKNNLKPGTYTLKISFRGILNDKMRGFYRSRYEFEDKTYHMGVTQFEATDARRAIPVFDEPDKKAVFEVSLKIPSDRSVISNTIEEEVLEHENGFKTVRFSPSPKMSSYLLAFIIGHFEHVKEKTKNGTLVRVFVTPGKLAQAKFALDVAVRCIEFYEKYFGIKYPLPTADLIAIPDFASGAMENWGAITYRETAILVDPVHSSTGNKQWVALVIAHELAHQWFGNLVTMEWWTHLWLNEGFASYMEYVAIDKLFPEWHIWSQFVFLDHARGLELDGLLSTHPIEVDVNHPGEISEIFDAVSYSKGASVIRMLAEYLGERNFSRGLQVYLKKHSYSNATTNDLWDALEQVSKKPVGKIMENWTRRPGYPLIKVKQNKNKLELTQARFFSSSLIPKDKSSKWIIPVSIKSEEKTDYHLLSALKTSIPYKARWIKVNKGETSFARVDYSADLSRLLEEQIKIGKSLSEEDRFGIIRDAFAASRAGTSTVDEALKLVSACKDEDQYIVWVEIISDLTALRQLLFGTELYEDFRLFTREILAPIAKKVGWEKENGESHTRPLLRSSILFSQGANGDEETIKKAKALFLNRKKIDADLRGLVYALVAENGGIKEFDLLMKMYKEEKMQEEKDRILRALCSFKEKSLLQKTIEFIFSDEVKAQDLFKGVALTWANPLGRDIAWEAVKKNWKFIEKKFAGGHLFDRFVMPAANFTKESEAREVEAFFKKNKVPGIERSIEQALEQIRSNAAWLSRDFKKIQDFLAPYRK